MLLLWASSSGTPSWPWFDWYTLQWPCAPPVLSHTVYNSGWNISWYVPFTRGTRSLKGCSSCYAQPHTSPILLYMESELPTGNPDQPAGSGITNEEGGRGSLPVKGLVPAGPQNEIPRKRSKNTLKQSPWILIQYHPMFFVSQILQIKKVLTRHDLFLIDTKYVHLTVFPFGLLLNQRPYSIYLHYFKFTWKELILCEEMTTPWISQNGEFCFPPVAHEDTEFTVQFTVQSLVERKGGLNLKQKWSALKKINFENDCHDFNAEQRMSSKKKNFLHILNDTAFNMNQEKYIIKKWQKKIKKKVGISPCFISKCLAQLQKQRQLQGNC